MISSTTWVPRGYAAEYPEKYDFDDEEIARISELAQLRLDEAKEDLEEARESAALKDQEEIDEDLKEYDLEHYDDDEEETAEGQPMGIFGSKNIQFYEGEGEKDPYITLPDAQEQDEEREELQILPTDNLVLAARTEDNLSYLEVYVYDDTVEEEEDGAEIARNNLYVHHDFLLSSFPLCVEWLDYRVGKTKDDSRPGNFAAISTFDPEIEIWNLDVVDSVYPDMVLGRPDGDTGAAELSGLKSKQKKKALKKKINDTFHVDAVLSLSANRMHRNLLASGSADTTVKLWDLNEGVCAKSFGFHDGKVSAVAWNPAEATVLLSGGYDHHAIVSDLRASEGAGQRRWKLDGDVEGLKWDSNGYEFYVSTENGRIHKLDARNESKAVWTLQAHDSEVTSFDINRHMPGFMVTGSTDKTVKLWNLTENRPSMILSRDLDVGKVFSVSFAPDKEAVGHIVAAGSNGTVKVWDSMANRTVREGVGKQITEDFAREKAKRKERVVEAVQSDDEWEDDEEETQEGENDSDDE
ncbi:hypothetical protein TRVA0_004S01376 [Trichomonascus vanleenenianus]|uniref:rRNA-processing protein PWP1 n=1 Tax=Trichomonascus vanleenenianus TaxID=2268995 RepID=UPI003ECA1136